MLADERRHIRKRAVRRNIKCIPISDIFRECEGDTIDPTDKDVPEDTWPSVRNKDKLMAMAINPMAYQKEIAVNKVALYNINVYESRLWHQVSLGDIMGRQRFATGPIVGRPYPWRIRREDFVGK
ncbi:hypothetical protein AVEN_243702-1 [Araneus ventricosus]|uniref:Uncharacterized protein n=1 Tax=Araneus ventricosus TaxID=182803 RepID=A0A4Y2A6I4_ARAVE|nr:hypothetical protein AVEN_243702-1 [Araneus ventricosus]